jgi:hypothetical protein
VGEIGADMYLSSASMGKLTFSGNNITLEGDGGKEYAYDFEYKKIADGEFLTSDFHIGSIDIYDNSFSSENSTAVEIYVAECANQMENGDFTLGGLRFTDNLASSVNGSAIVSGFEGNAMELSGTSTAKFGSVLMNNNTILTNSTTGGVGMDLDSWVYNGVGLTDLSKVSFGDFEFNGNNISSGDYGINIEDWTYWGAAVSYDIDADEPRPGACQFSMGHTEFNGNNITSGRVAIRLSEMGDMGETVYGHSVVNIGDIEFSENTVSGLMGISVGSFAYLGSELHEFSSTSLGAIRINNNTVNSSDTGILVDDKGGIVGIGIDMEDYSTFSGSGVEICGNRINSTAGMGMDIAEIDAIAGGLSGNAISVMGPIRFNNNTIESEGDALNLRLSETVIALEGNAYAELSGIELSDNNISSNASGITVSITDVAVVMAEGA